MSCLHNNLNNACFRALRLLYLHLYQQPMVQIPLWTFSKAPLHAWPIIRMDWGFEHCVARNTCYCALPGLEKAHWYTDSISLIHALKTSSPWRVDASLKLLWSRRLEAHSRDTWRFLGDQQSVQVSVSSMWTPDGNAAAADDGKWILRMHWRRTESRRCLAWWQAIISRIVMQHHMIN